MSAREFTVLLEICRSTTQDDSVGDFVALVADSSSRKLRAVTSLSRLLQRQGKNDEARRMLAEIYGWFTEGFDTADLKDAKALLEELST